MFTLHVPDTPGQFLIEAATINNVWTPATHLLDHQLVIYLINSVTSDNHETWFTTDKIDKIISLKDDGYNYSNEHTCEARIDAYRKAIAEKEARQKQAKLRVLSEFDAKLNAADINEFGTVITEAPNRPDKVVFTTYAAITNLLNDLSAVSTTTPESVIDIYRTLRGLYTTAEYIDMSLNDDRLGAFVRKLKSFFGALIWNHEAILVYRELQNIAPTLESVEATMNILKRYELGIKITKLYDRKRASMKLPEVITDVLTQSLESLLAAREVEERYGEELKRLQA
jgi:hypothetical protein